MKRKPLFTLGRSKPARVDITRDDMIQQARGKSDPGLVENIRYMRAYLQRQDREHAKTPADLVWLDVLETEARRRSDELRAVLSTCIVSFTTDITGAATRDHCNLLTRRQQDPALPFDPPGR